MFEESKINTHTVMFGIDFFKAGIQYFMSGIGFSIFGI